MPSAAGAPQSVSVDPTVAETTTVLTWLNASGGTDNAITGYEIQYSDSSNGTSWSAWAAYGTVTNSAPSIYVNVNPTNTRGYYRRFQVRTRGTAGSAYYSPWKISSNSVRKNTPPNPPTSIVILPETYSLGVVTISWSGASGGTSPIKGYMIASRTSKDNSTWSEWNVLTTFDRTQSSGTYQPEVSRIPGTYTQFGIWTIGILK